MQDVWDLGGCGNLQSRLVVVAPELGLRLRQPLQLKFLRCGDDCGWEPMQRTAAGEAETLARANTRWSLSGMAPLLSCAYGTCKQVTDMQRSAAANAKPVLDSNRLPKPNVVHAGHTVDACAVWKPRRDKCLLDKLQHRSTARLRDGGHGRSNMRGEHLRAGCGWLAVSSGGLVVHRRQHGGGRAVAQRASLDQYELPVTSPSPDLGRRHNVAPGRLECTCVDVAAVCQHHLRQREIRLRTAACSLHSRQRRVWAWRAWWRAGPATQ